MERYCSTGQSPQRAVVPMEKEKKEKKKKNYYPTFCIFLYLLAY
jgi:hypothetical protein